MEDIRLVALDIDGTLLDPTRTLRPRTRAAVRSLVERGLEVVLATGRIHVSAAEFARELGTSAPIVSVNGSLVRAESGQTVDSWAIPPDEVDRALERTRPLGLPTYLLLADEILVPEEHRSSTRALDAWTGGRHYRIVDSLAADGVPVYQIHFIAPPASGPRSRDAIEAALGSGGIDYFSYPSGSGLTYHIEARRSGVDKGTGILAAAKSLDLEARHILAVGDWLNDVPLLAAAAIGVAMGGAPEPLLAAADLVAPGSSAEDGLARFLEEFFALPAATA